MTITAGKIGVANVALPAQDGASLALTGGLDLNTGSVEARATLSSPPPRNALIAIRPELAVELKGPLAAPRRTLDLAALTGWLTLRAAELQTRRLESIEANSRQEVIGRAVRPPAPLIRLAPAGKTVEAEQSAPMFGMRGLDLLQPDAAPTGGTSTSPTVKPRSGSASPPAVPPTAGPAVTAPLNLLGP
jgi:large subunit ribosomal protein L24